METSINNDTKEYMKILAIFSTKNVINTEDYKLKIKLTSKCVCGQSVNKIITVRNLNNRRIFVNEVENSI
jgi:hypothetical protein